MDDHSLTAALCSDAQWSDLLEHRRSNADIFDLISIRETQHSDLLAWLFNSREGHGQGDSIFRDFLVAVYRAATGEEPGDKIYGNGLTKSFVRQWTPARIMTTGFSTAAFFREYTLPAATAKEASCKLDLLAIDTDNKFLLAIENKAGAKLTSDQLGRYVRGLQTCLLGRGAFAGYEVGLVALDRNYDLEDDPDDDFDGRWALLNYDWLGRAARRAEMSEHRGNKDSSIVLSYSRQQINYESANFASVNKLARDLAIQHKDAVSALRKTRSARGNPASWTPTDLNASSLDGQLLRLLTQHREACDLLIDLPQIELLHASVCDIEPALAEDERYAKRRVFIAYRIKALIPSADDCWPLEVAVRHLNVDSRGEPRFRITLVWRPNLVTESERPRYMESIRR